MAMCAVGDSLVLFGGVGAAGTESILDVANDCWVFDTVSLTWREVPMHGMWPSPRRCAGVAPAASGLFLWGGSGVSETGSETHYNFLNDCWRFEIATGQWSVLHESDDHRQAPLADGESVYPSPRYTPVLQPANGKLFLFGGYTEDRLGKRKLNDAWLAEGHTWRRVPESGVAGYDGEARWPGRRYGCMSAASGEDVFICGGFSDDGDHNDVWRFDAREGRWDLLAPESSGPEVPAPRYCAALAHHARRLFLFGGRSRRHPKLNFNDLWVFELDQLRWRCLRANHDTHDYGPTARVPGYHAKASSAVVHDDWYIWGGEGLAGHVSDFWRFSLTRHAWELVQAARDDDPRFW